MWLSGGAIVKHSSSPCDAIAFCCCSCCCCCCCCSAGARALAPGASARQPKLQNSAEQLPWEHVSMHQPSSIPLSGEAIEWHCRLFWESRSRSCSCCRCCCRCCRSSSSCCWPVAFAPLEARHSLLQMSLGQ